MNSLIKIGIAEDHQLMRQGMISLLEEEEDIEVSLEASNGSELLNKLEETNISVVLLDLEMPIINGHQALEVISKKHPNIKVIIVSSHYSDEFIWETVKNGARGFLAKNSDIEIVIDAIRSVHETGYYFDEKLTANAFESIVKKETIDPKITNMHLTQREIDILKLICEGKTTKEISDYLCISYKTVETHRTHIFDKTKAKNIAGVIVFGLKHGFYQIQS